MNERLSTAARTGNVSDLYSLIQRDGNVLRHFDEVEFVETPLHIAAEEGCIRFAIELMNLKPSFARKLNHQGLSPIHLALKKGHKEMVLRFLEIDKDLVRVLIRTLKKNNYYWEEVNRKDEDGNTALHIAASNNQTQMLKLLLSCKADKHATNQSGLTALDVAEQHNKRESVRILRGCFSPGVSNIKSKWEKQIVKYVAKASSIIFDDLDNISSDYRNALLVVFGLLLTGTYQATLSPPGGVWQGDNTSWRKRSKALGRSVLDQSEFLLFYIPTYVVFMILLQTVLSTL
ncbi:ankyrin repeat-containing protein BDA1-like [Gossypium hirsutum]|uniref:Ankyrin repeat-containing protein BDA1-like n=1 Tax=Gossypium hirsutum TaxID=3635 RepID=A0ABM3ASY4_GOSHI|nr:ankyrin repeat-containing protein BDA1-like [Gossypium hirsutum]